MAWAGGCEGGGEGGGEGVEGGVVRLDGGAADAGAVADSEVDAACDGAVDAAVLDGGGDDGGPVDAGAAVDLGADAAPDAGRVEPMGPREVIHVAVGAQRPGEAFAFEVPDGLDAVLLQARGAVDGVYLFEQIEGPGGSLIGAGRSRVTLNPEVAVALIPSADRAGPPPGGRWTVTIAAAGADERPVEVELYGVRGRGEALRVNVLVPPATGRGVDDLAVDAMARSLGMQLEAAFGWRVEVAVGALADETPGALVIDGAMLDFGGLAALGAGAVEEYGPGLDVYLVERITDGGNVLTAFSGGLPAPLGLRGTAASVVAVPIGLIDDFPVAVADRAVHELGHALGLFHTTEPFGDRDDPISDTAVCPRVCDADGDGVLFARECGAQGRGEAPCRGAADNLMFWTLGGLRTVTAGQRAVVGGHPVIEGL